MRGVTDPSSGFLRRDIAIKDPDRPVQILEHPLDDEDVTYRSDAGIPNLRRGTHGHCSRLIQLGAAPAGAAVSEQ
jgi:hypothetical protein